MPDMLYLYVNVLSGCNQPNVANKCCQEGVFGLIGTDHLDYSQIITIKSVNGMLSLSRAICQEIL